MCSTCAVEVVGYIPYNPTTGFWHASHLFSSSVYASAMSLRSVPASDCRSPVMAANFFTAREITHPHTHTHTHPAH